MLVYLAVLGFLVVAVGVVLAKFGVASYFEALLGELGRTHGTRLAAAATRRSVRKQADRGARRAAMHGLRLSSARVRPSDGPDADSAEGLPSLAPGVRLIPGPFAGRRPVLVCLGGDSQRWAGDARSAIASVGGASDILLVVVGGHSLEQNGVRRFSGDLYEQARSALEVADAVIARGQADYLAVLLRVPLTGSFDGDRQLDLDNLFSLILDPLRDVWVTYLAPADISAWPDEVILHGPGGPLNVHARLDRAGTSWEQVPIPLAGGLRVGRADAARALLALIGDSSPHGVATVQPPRYDARLAILLDPAASQELRAKVEVDALPGLSHDHRMREFSIRYLEGDTPVNVDLADFGRQIVAYQIGRHHGSIQSAERSRVAHRGTNGGENAAETLRQAIRDDDPLLALSPLVREGRAWIESTRAADYRADLEAALVAFGRSSPPGVWAHYLLSLDRALQRHEANSEAFDEEAVVRADAGGAGLLYAAEAMEFARLNGDLAEACARADRLLNSLTSPTSAQLDDVSAYVHGTTRLVLGNLLRNGGRYREAESWVQHAQSFLNPRRPSQRVEDLHCRYALGVCAAMMGRVRLQPIEADHGGELVFGRSLVVLANAHAAWIDGDIDRAVQFATMSRDGFDEIRYDRYSRRADDLASLLRLWRQLGTLPHVDRIFADSSIMLNRPLIRDIVDPGRRSDPVDLQRVRPSRALGVLAFGIRFARDADCRRPVRLPPVISLVDNSFRIESPTVTQSISEADAVLRLKMGLPAGAQVPLLAD